LHALRQLPKVEIVLWTASTRETGTPVVAQLQQNSPIFDEVIFRNDAWFTEPIHTKDLRLLGRDLDKVVVLDNAPNCCKLNPQHGVLVEDFTGTRSERDGTLVNCYYILEYLLECRRERKVGVKEGLLQLEEEGQLCRPVYYALPDSWANANLRDIAPLRIPPNGKYLRASATPPSASTMKHWTF